MVTFGELKCELCGVSGSQVSMHRTNPKGETGCWRCEPCLGRPVEEEVLRITDAYEVDNMRRRFFVGQSDD